MPALEPLNTLSPVDAEAAFGRCCGAARWARQMAARRPFQDVAELLQTADAVWWGLSEADWREAFAHHPRIGDVERLRERFARTAAWSAGEQAAVAKASEDVLHALAEGNRAYEARFGYIFIVCATGRGAGEMLDLLRARLPNAPSDELRIAAEEQRKITRTRLEKLLQELEASYG